MNEKRVKFHLRLLADFIDIVIAVLFGSVIAIFITDLALGSENVLTEADKFTPQAQYLINVIFSAFILLYFLIEAFTGFTAGKFLIRVRVAKENGLPADLKTYFIRYIIKNFGLILVVIGSLSGFTLLAQIGSGFILIILIGTIFSVRESRQAIHDAYSKTAVFKISDLKKALIEEQNKKDDESGNINTNQFI
jgi:uncharacterized RDD family membrane protein YckC